MPDSIVPTMNRPAASRRTGWLTRAAKRVVLSRLDALNGARVTIIDSGEVLTLGCGGDAALRTTVWVHDPLFYRDVLTGGVNGAAESFIAGRWSCDDLTALVRVFARNLDNADGMQRGPARLAAAAASTAHRFNRNTQTGSRKNIQAHYDLGNDFFELFLDPTMTYSSAVFEHATTSLVDAQRAKYDRICRKLDLQPHHRVIEIGTGWGGFAIHAAGRFGCHVTTTTISDRQYELAVERVQEYGLSDRIDVVKNDYRDLSGKFDRLVSIEMIEAVGAEFYQTYFNQCSELLADDGAGVIQAITIADQRYERARKHVDFIKRYVFPGSCIPSVTAMCEAITAASDLRMAHLEDLTPHYARTLRRWRRRLMSHRDEVLKRGYSEQLLRLWDFYLSYCEGGFAERNIGLVQMQLVKPRWQGKVVMGTLDDKPMPVRPRLLDLVAKG